MSAWNFQSLFDCQPVFETGSIILLLTLVLGLCAPLREARGADEKLEAAEERAFRQAAAVTGASIVRVQTVGGLDRVGKLLAGTGPTTGVVVSSDGYVVSSAFNFASQPASILIQLADGRRFPAKLVATDRSKMLTLLKIEADDLIPIPSAEKESIRVGQWAIALGRTLEAAEPSISVGIVSALNRIWGRAIQTDAKVSPVNYGGPLVDVEGKALGILVPLSMSGQGETAGVEWYDSGIGFAIPMPDVFVAVQRLKSGKDLHSGLMGITFKNGPLDAAAVIDRVRKTSPADEAGLKSGDVITEVDGQTVHRQAEVKQAIGSKYSGETIAIRVTRGEESIRSEVTLVAELSAYESGFLGILPIREAGGTPAASGVGIRYVYPDSPAAAAGLQKRDRLVRIADVEVADTGSLLGLVSRLRPNENTSLVYLRDGKETSIEVELATLPNDVPGELTSAVSRLPEETAPEAKPSPTGRFTVEMESHQHSYWAYVPDDYNPASRYAVMVWIHPSGDTMEATIYNRWKTICDLRGILIVAPKASKISGWELNEAEFVKDALEDFSGKYEVDRSRVFLHSFSQGGPFALHLAFRFREKIRGAAIAAAPLLARPPENDPDYRLQFHFVCGDQDNLFTRVEKTANALRSIKYPVSFTRIGQLDHKYPPSDQIREIGRWADCLDRI